MEHAADADLASILAVAVSCAREAGGLIRAACGSASVDHTKSNPRDLVTVVDVACQGVIERAVAAAFPSHTVLGEEAVAPGSSASAAALAAALQVSGGGSGWLWVCDPLDGTTNFCHGLPLSVVSIGVAHRGVVHVAAIFNPYRDELFTAIRGRGAHLNGAPLRVAATADLGAALFSVGFHSDERVGATMMRGAAALLPRVRGVRNLGSAALHLAYVAAGRLSGFWELDLNAWDLAAGCLLITEAGGRVADMRGCPYALAVRDIFATCGAPGVHEAGLAVLAAADAASMPR
jgi:myo-inositol-1(or 4)-monophosphatase